MGAAREEKGVFQTGDTVVYATHGVGVVRDTGERTVLGEAREMIEVELASLNPCPG